MVRSLPVLLAALAAAPVAADAASISENYGRLPLQFEANRGQTGKSVQFLARGPGYGVYLSSGHTVLTLAKERAALRMKLEGARPRARASGLDELPGKANYFIGNDPSKWRTGVPTYAKVRYEGVYPGIDLVYYGNQRQLEYDFVVAPGADPKRILLRFRGMDRMEVDAQGDLVLHLGAETIRQKKPIVYQDIDGVRRDVAGRYALKGRNRVGFRVAAYDRSRPLVIDPVLAYSTFLGGNGQDNAFGMAVDGSGSVYVVGSTSSTNFPTVPGAPANIGGAFVAKLSPSGDALVYSAFLSAAASKVAVDADGNAYVAGLTGSGLPVTPGAFQTTYAGSVDAFVTKLNPAGSALVYSTFLGGSQFDFIADIAVDGSGSAYVTGSTSSRDFPVTPGAIQPVFKGGNTFPPMGPDPTDAFVAKLNPTGTALVYATYLGGSGDDTGKGIAVDASGSAYVTGQTDSPEFPTTPDAFQPVAPAGVNAFVTKVNPLGLSLVYSTFLGGSSFDLGHGIALDAAGNAYVSGFTQSLDFPVTPGAVKPTTGGEGDLFVAKLDSTGSSLVYSTYFGGSASDGNSDGGVAVDSRGNAYVVAATSSADLPITAGAFQPAYGGGRNDAFVAMLDASGSHVLFSSYLGGSLHEHGFSIAIDRAGGVYVSGVTASPDFPTANALQPVFGGDAPYVVLPDDRLDGFVAKIQISTAARSEENAAVYTGSWRSFGAETGSFSGGAIRASNSPGTLATFSFTGKQVDWLGVKCNVCGIAAVSLDGGPPKFVDTAGPAAPGGLSSQVVFSASGLAGGVTHTLTILVNGRTRSAGRYVAVDAFDVAP